MVDLIGNLFDPSLNLFRKTSQAHVYPSPMTNVSETNHLELIEFSGKMLAKAVYEVRSRLLFSYYGYDDAELPVRNPRDWRIFRFICSESCRPIFAISAACRAVIKHYLHTYWRQVKFHLFICMDEAIWESKLVGKVMLNIFSSTFQLLF